MATLQRKIAETFLAKLAETKEIDAEKLAQLEALLSTEKKAKVDDFVKVFQMPLGDDVK